MKPLPVSFSVFIVCGSIACSDDGTTPLCPPRSLYDIRDPAVRSSDKVVSERVAAWDEGCATLPATGGSTSGSGGTSSAGGSAGTSSAGTAGTAGGS
jgi:hypothetical protein